MKVKMIIGHIIKELLKSKVIYSFELIYSHGLVSGITSLSMILLIRPESLLLAGLAKSLIFKKCFCFYQEICFSFVTNAICKFQKDINSVIHWQMIILKITINSFKLLRSVFSRLEISIVLMEFFTVFFKWNIFFELPWSFWKVY